MLNGKQFTENELYTILTEIEAASNMRPLTVTSENLEDNNIIPLTPCHLIIGNAIRTLPGEIYSNKEKEKKITKDLTERWKERKQVSNNYWNLWREEYLTTLRKLTKINYAKRHIKEGDVELDFLDRKKSKMG